MLSETFSGIPEQIRVEIVSNFFQGLPSFEEWHKKNEKNSRKKSVKVFL